MDTIVWLEELYPMSDASFDLEQALQCVDSSWNSFFASQAPELNMIFDTLRNMESPVQLTPGALDVFRAFEISARDVRVVVLGQDPYPTPGLAIGRAFAISHDAKMPASLKNIEKELQRSLGTNSPLDQTLRSWSEQGVFLLNTALTLNLSTKNQGHFAVWDRFICAALKFLSAQPQTQVWMLWGSKAAKYAEFAGAHEVLTTSHPSPLSSYRGFSGSDIFVKCNTILQNLGSQPIRWLNP